MKTDRLEAIKMLISSREMHSQEDIMKALEAEGYSLTQATLSRDLKQLKVAKAASMNGTFVYVLPHETMYKRVVSTKSAKEMLEVPGFLSLRFTGNMGVIKTRPGYAAMIAYNIDMENIEGILGTIAGADTIFVAVAEEAPRTEIAERLKDLLWEK